MNTEREVNNIIYLVHWDCNDARFFFYDDMAISDVDKWKAKVLEKALTHIDKLMTDYEEDKDCFYDEFETFEEWVYWCIKNFVSLDRYKVDNYK